MGTTAEARAWVGEGRTLCARGIERENPALAAVLAALGRALPSTGGAYVSAYVTPPGSGFGLHFDAKDVVILQVAGTKSWRYWQAPAVENPVWSLHISELGRFDVSHPSVGIRWPRADLAEEALLEPGDALYLPAGVWHEAVGVDLSLSLSFAFPNLPLCDVAVEAIRVILEDLPELRRDIAAWGADAEAAARIVGRAVGASAALLRERVLHSDALRGVHLAEAECGAGSTRGVASLQGGE